MARIGLIEAAQRFDPAKGDFVAFAVPTISGVIKRHFRDHAWLVRPPRSTQELSIRVRDRWPDLAQRLGAEPSTADLARDLSDSPETVSAARTAGVGFTAAALLPNDPGLCSTEAQSDFERAEAKLIVDALMPRLSPEEREILRYRFYFRMSQEEIAMRTGTNQMHVSRQLTRLLAKLRDMLGHAGRSGHRLTTRRAAVAAGNCPSRFVRFGTWHPRRRRHRSTTSAPICRR